MFYQDFLDILINTIKKLKPKIITIKNILPFSTPYLNIKGKLKAITNKAPNKLPIKLLLIMLISKELVNLPIKRAPI